jgi:hypothetical protein
MSTLTTNQKEFLKKVRSGLDEPINEYTRLVFKMFPALPYDSFAIYYSNLYTSHLVVKIWDSKKDNERYNLGIYDLSEISISRKVIKLTHDQSVFLDKLITSDLFVNQLDGFVLDGADYSLTIFDEKKMAAASWKHESQINNNVVILTDRLSELAFADERPEAFEISRGREVEMFDLFYKKYLDASTGPKFKNVSCGIIYTFFCFPFVDDKYTLTVYPNKEINLLGQVLLSKEQATLLEKYLGWQIRKDRIELTQSKRKTLYSQNNMSKNESFDCDLAELLEKLWRLNGNASMQKGVEDFFLQLTIPWEIDSRLMQIIEEKFDN